MNEWGGHSRAFHRCTANRVTVTQPHDPVGRFESCTVRHFYPQTSGRDNLHPKNHLQHLEEGYSEDK